MDTPAGKASDLIVRRSAPFNAEPVPARLLDGFLTATPDFYVRNHGPIPDLDADHRIVVDGLVARPLELSLADLRARFAERTVTATIQCAGNRRGDLQLVAKTAGDPWGPAAIGTATWTGCVLAEVLAAAGVEAGAAHVGFTAAEMAEGGGTVAPYEVSIPLAGALRPGTMLAWGMNGAPLTPAHGYPLRTIVPGQAGVRSVKWLTRIELRATPTEAPMHARDYKYFPPDVTADTADWATGPSIYELPVNAAICAPGEGAEVAAGSVTVAGWAMAYGRAVLRVEVSGDGGHSWQAAALTRGPDHDSWVQWTTTLDLPPGAHELVVRAVDAAGQGQPEHPAQLWNFKGYLSAAWHRITVRAR